MGLGRWPVLPAAPLIALVEAAEAAPTMTAQQGALSRAWHRAVASGAVTRPSGDKLAMELLGKHPCEVWGADWWTDEPAE